MEENFEQSKAEVTEEVKGCSEGRPFTAETFLEYLSPSHDRWQPTREDDDSLQYGLPEGTAWIFRGMSNSSWELIPSLWRKCNQQVIRLVESQLGNQEALNEERLKAYEEVYKRLLKEFKTRTDLLGLLPNSELDGKDPKVSVFDEMTDLDALAQHHFIPTHLLDWTLNPRIAAYFAAEGGDAWTECCVYAFNVTRVSPQIPTNVYNLEDIPRTHIRTATHSTSLYLRSQLGVFTHLPNSQDYFKANGRWPDLESAFVEWSNEPGNTQKFPVLQKIILRASEKRHLIELLRRQFITRAHLMPTLDNVGQEVMADSGRIISAMSRARLFPGR